MAVHMDAIIDFLLHDAVQDMGTTYESLRINPRLTEDTPFMALIWNEGPIQTRYSMETHGVYAMADLEIAFVGQRRRVVGQAQVDFEDALLGTTPERGHPHHNIAGFPVTYEDMNQFQSSEDDAVSEGLGSYYFSYRDDRDGNGPYRPVHVIEKVAVKGKSLPYDTGNRTWRGTVSIEVHISNTGQEEE